jgi:hypothetical protein
MWTKDRCRIMILTIAQTVRIEEHFAKPRPEHCAFNRPLSASLAGGDSFTVAAVSCIISLLALRRDAR